MKARNVLIPGLAMAGAGLVCAGAAVAAAGACAVRRRSGRRLDGQVVAITGGSRGLGLALAEEFGRRGARLALSARNAEELGRARALLLRRKAAREEDVLTLAADLRQAEEAEWAIREATQQFGRVDILVNNAGVITVGPVENQPVSEFRETMDANFFSAVQCTMAVLPQMIERREGTIVNIASIGGKVAVPHLLPYSASKFALVGFSEGLHAELRAKGVHVLTVCPGLMRTGSHLAAQFSGDSQREYRWFSVAGNLPGMSTSAARAARRIVRAVIARETEIAITMQAMVAARLGAVAPEVTLRAMALANRILPGASSEAHEKKPGAEVRGSKWGPASRIGAAAARRYNQGG